MRTPTYGKAAQVSIIKSKQKGYFNRILAI